MSTVLFEVIMLPTFISSMIRSPTGSLLEIDLKYYLRARRKMFLFIVYTLPDWGMFVNVSITCLVNLTSIPLLIALFYFFVCRNFRNGWIQLFNWWFPVSWKFVELREYITYLSIVKHICTNSNTRFEYISYVYFGVFGTSDCVIVNWKYLYIFFIFG